MTDSIPYYQDAAQLFRSVERQKEYVCVRLLLEKIIGREVEITHNENGKPMLKGGGHVSISHTKGYCAVMVSWEHPVAVDIEYISDRVGRIAHRFLRADEQVETSVGLLIHWSAKETLYKLFSEDRLLCEEMRIIPFEECGRGVIGAENLKRKQPVEINYIVTDAYVLTYASA
ncbi:MAG: 4'-phosphopantetheinyl transferase superfamily protein [Prevotellaceae bacterium]|nr:4'-phosphopantetheinyl transferase superfamily protein [Prevotella sp.]MDD7257180.1 4'-phosphopantetheinyl transferase superfamily protein [Prevotellaceae bacterium]MDY6130384.1 4'-phosphopantetheinyl transferase [Prevotella sp.]